MFLSSTLILVLSIAELVFLIAMLTVIDAGTRQWTGVVVAFVIAGLNYLAPKLTRPALWLAPVFFLVWIAMVVVINMLFYWYHDQDNIGRELIMTLLALVPITLTGKSVAYMAYACFGRGWQWLNAVPVVIAAVAAFNMVIDTFVSYARRR